MALKTLKVADTNSQASVVDRKSMVWKKRLIMCNPEWEEQVFINKPALKKVFFPWNFFQLLFLQNLRCLSVILQCIKLNELVHKVESRRFFFCFCLVLDLTIEGIGQAFLLLLGSHIV